MSTQSYPITYTGTSLHARSKNPLVHLAHEGNFFSINCGVNGSHYNGLSYLVEIGQMIKVIDSIRPSGTFEKLEVSANSCTLYYSTGVAWIGFIEDVLCYEFTGKDTLSINVDLRDIYNKQTDDRLYQVQMKNSAFHECLFSSQGLSAIIIADQALSRSDEWVEHPTIFDEHREGVSSWWVYEVAKVEVARKVRLSCSLAVNAEKARKIHANVLWGSKQEWGEFPELLLAQKSLESLMISSSEDVCILAGLPWFFQVWGRDELIAAGGLIAQGSFDHVGSILKRQIKQLRKDAKLPNRFPHADLGSSDALGWWAVRASQLLSLAPKTLSDEDWSYFHSQLSIAIQYFIEKNGTSLIETGPQETWMDTVGSTQDNRSGYRIEIQALHLAILKAHNQLSQYLGKEKVHFEYESNFRSLVRSTFFVESKGLLKDGSDDDTIRPNVFIAHYCYPELLQDDQWTKVYTITLDSLLSPWGGLSSISVDSPLFHANHSGSQDDSYHRGDSWYWINNLAALGCFRLGGSLKTIGEHILAASSTDLISLGACGHCSEISGFSLQEQFGCWSQAWSASTLIELLKESQHPL